MKLLPSLSYLLSVFQLVPWLLLHFSGLAQRMRSGFDRWGGWDTSDVDEDRFWRVRSGWGEGEGTARSIAASVWKNVVMVFSFMYFIYFHIFFTFHCWLYNLCIVMYVTNKTWNLSSSYRIYLKILNNILHSKFVKMELILVLINNNFNFYNICDLYVACNIYIYIYIYVYMCNIPFKRKTLFSRKWHHFRGKAAAQALVSSNSGFDGFCDVLVGLLL